MKPIFVTKPYDHQRAALKASDGAKAFAYLMDMRTGKTKVVIDEIHGMYEAGAVKTLVVVAPLGVHAAWIEDEWEKHGPVRQRSKDYHGHGLCPPHIHLHAYRGGTTKTEQQEIKNLVKAKGLVVFTINWDAIITANGWGALALVLSRGRDAMLVADEAHRMKSHSAQRTKKMLKLRTMADYRRILTGTLVANSPLDVWAPFQFLDPNILGCNNFFAFRRIYALLQTRYMHGRSFQEVIGYQRQDLLKEKIAPHSYSITAAECLGLPPRQYSTIRVDMSAEQKRLYKAMADELRAEWEGKAMTAPLALTQLLRFQQLLGGFFVPDEQGPEALKQPNPRMAALLSLIEDAPGKVIIWTRFVAEREQISDNLRFTFGAGSVAEVTRGDEAEVAIDRFRTANGQCRFMVANPEGTAGEGRDFSMASTMIYYSNSFKHTARQQSEARCDKKGRGGTVAVIDIIARGSVDNDIVRSLKMKKDVAKGFSGQELMNWLAQSNNSRP